jgi:hypothetical protein
VRRSLLGELSHALWGTIPRRGGSETPISKAQRLELVGRTILRKQGYDALQFAAQMFLNLPFEFIPVVSVLSF